jgi:hypothetical protein
MQQELALLSWVSQEEKACILLKLICLQYSKVKRPPPNIQMQKTGAGATRKL